MLDRPTKHTTHVPPPLLSQLSKFIGSELGLHFPRGHWQSLNKGICRAASEEGFESAEAYATALLSSPWTANRLESLVGHLTNGETYFFRDHHLFEVLREHIIPGLIRSQREGRKVMRFWSAGCCTGEEPYSLAMILQQLIPDYRDWKITILATDLNSSFLETAEKGVYSAWSFRRIPAWAKKRYFKRVGRNQWAICPSIKRMVTFRKFNLVSNGYPELLNGMQALDLILCRNVLIYFSQDMGRRVISRLTRCLDRKRWLAVSPCEYVHVRHAELFADQFPQTTLFRRNPGDRSRSAARSFRNTVPLTLPDLNPRIGMANPLSVESPGRLSPRPPAAGTGSLPAVSDGELDDLLERELGDGCQKQKVLEEALLLREMSRGEEAASQLMEQLDPVESGDGPCAQEAAQMSLLAELLADLGRLVEAREWGERAAAVSKLDPGSYYLLASINEEQGHLEEAAALLKKTLYLDPEYVMAYVSLGSLFKRLNRDEEAGKSLANALQLLQSMDPSMAPPRSGGIAAGHLVNLVQAMSGGDLNE